ncbi:MAG: hypothetical protein HKN62_09385 [Phycisphaerales bacterium]|nr:hypothetical protein [Phycisphaerales bacterium]
MPATVHQPVLDRALRADVERWRARGVPEPIVAILVAERMIPTLVAEPGHRHLLIVPTPGLPTTGLRRLTEMVTGLPCRRLTRVAGGADLDEGRLASFVAAPAFAVAPLRATIDAMRWLRAVNARPIVIVDDVFDRLAAAADRLAGDDDERRWYAVRRLGPAVVTFLASWRTAAASLPVHWLRTRDLDCDPAGVVRRAFAHAGFTPDADTLAAALAEIDIIPREIAMPLSGEQRAAVRDLARAYAELDLSIAGL